MNFSITFLYMSQITVYARHIQSVQLQPEFPSSNSDKHTNTDEGDLCDEDEYKQPPIKSLISEQATDNSYYKKIK